MAQGTVEVFRGLVDRWNAGDRDFQDLPEYFDPAIELVSPFSSVVGEPYRGHAGIERWVSDVDEQFAEWRIDLDDVREIDEQVLAIGTIHARGRTSDIALMFPFASVIHFASDNRVARVHIYPAVGEALEAVGLAG